MEIKRWVQEKLECKSEDMEELFNSKTALHFLLVWNIFNKYCTNTVLGDVAIKLSRSRRIQDLQTIIEYFHNRYKNHPERYRHLKHDQQMVRIPDDVVSSPLSSSSTEQKLHFLLYVLFRYRNNMFHGNKGLINWLQYDQKIIYCTEAMCMMVDMHKELVLNVQNGLYYND